MKQLLQKLKSGEMQILEVPDPVPGRGEVLVRNRFSLISAGTEGSLVQSARKGWIGKAKERPQHVARVVEALKTQGPVNTYRQVMKKLDNWSPLGYSCAGEVIRVGEGVSGLAAGDLAACGGVTASHAEVVVVPANLCVRLDPGAHLEKAAYNTLGAIALQGVRQADLRLGESCVVIGLGLLGQLTVMLLKAAGVKVAGIDIAASPVSKALECGADLALARDTAGLEERIDEATGGLGADAVIIAAAGSSLDPINLAGRLARKKGKVVVVGAVPTGFDRDPHWYRKELDLRMACSYGPGRYDPFYEESGHDYPAAYVRWTENRNMQAFQALVLEGKVDPSLLTTRVIPLEEAEQAYDLIMKKGEPVFGMLLRYREDAPAPTGKVVLRGARGAAPVGIGFIGAGNYAQGFLLPNVPKSSDYALKGILTASGAGSRSAAERFGFEFCATEEKEIFEDTMINTVFVTTRHDSHAAYTVKALRAGKNVYVEKPLCLSVEELDEIGEVYGSAAGSPLLMVGFNRRFAPLSRQMKSVFGDAPAAITYRVNAGPVPADHWVLDPKSGGGRLVGEVCHFIDYLTFLSGSLPVTVHADALRDGEGRSDTVSVTLTFADGSLGSIVYCTNSSRAVPKERVEVSSAGITAVLRDFRDLEVFGKKRELRKRLTSQDKGQKAMVGAFLEAARTGGESPIPFGEIVAVTQATFAGVESLRTGKKIGI